MPEKKVTCDCGKTMRGANDEELVSVVQKHAKDAHNMTLTRDRCLRWPSQPEGSPLTVSDPRWRCRRT